jgi:hypothetical protein
MRILKNTLYVLGAILLVVWLASRVMSSYFAPYLAHYYLSNTNELRNLTEFPSPNNNVVVESFNIYGGATSTDVTQLLIRPHGEQFDPRSNFCLLSVEGLKKTKVVWVSDTKLDIQYESGVVYKAATEWNGISVPNFFVIVAEGAIGIVAFWGFDRTGVVICDRNGRIGSGPEPRGRPKSRFFIF